MKARLALPVALACILHGWSARAYRTANDEPQFAGEPQVRWAQPDVTFRINEQTPPDMSLLDVEEAAVKAVSTWSEPSCSGIAFHLQQTTFEMARPGDGINTIQWVLSDWSAHGWSPDAAGATDVQYAQGSDGTWSIVEADIYLNAENHRWVSEGATTDNRRDLLSVLTHETGHALGLLHPCEVGGASGAPDCASDPTFAQRTMYPIYSANQQALSSDDEAGVCALYPRPSCDMTGCPTGSACTASGCVVQCEGAACDRQYCVHDADCSAGQLCRDNECVGRSGAGDPCQSDHDCDKGLCSKGFCAGTCAGDACADQRPLGAPCTASSECLGGECLVGTSATPVCTRPCGEDAPACPTFWSCTPVGEKSVCAPTEVTARGSGCAVTTTIGRAKAWTLSWPLLLLLVLRLKRSSPSVRKA